MDSNNAFQEQSTMVKASTSSRVIPKRVSLQNRMFKMGNFVGVNAYRLSRAALKQHYAESRYQIAITPHFLVCSRPEAPTMVIHWFAPKAIDANLGHYFTEELKSLVSLNTLKVSVMCMVLFSRCGGGNRFLCLTESSRGLRFPDFFTT